MESQPVPPEECLRSLTAAAWLRAFPGHDLLPDSLGVMAAANALVMLGLPPVPEACERLTVTVSTLWESAWADVDLPGRTA